MGMAGIWLVEVQSNKKIPWDLLINHANATSKQSKKENYPILVGILRHEQAIIKASRLAKEEQNNEKK